MIDYDPHPPFHDSLKGSEPTLIVGDQASVSLSFEVRQAAPNVFAVCFLSSFLLQSASTRYRHDGRVKMRVGEGGVEAYNRAANPDWLFLFVQFRNSDSRSELFQTVT